MMGCDGKGWARMKGGTVWRGASRIFTISLPISDMLTTSKIGVMDANRITAAAAAAAGVRVTLTLTAAARNISHDDEQQAKQERIDAEALGRRQNFDPKYAHHQQQHGELEQADDEDVIDQRNKRRRLKLISTLEQNNRRRQQFITTLEREREYSSRKRYKSEELVDPFRTLVETFLRKLRNDVHDMLCAKECIDVDNYRGLDSTRDTEEQVEAMLKLFPVVLTRKHPHLIRFLAFNLKAVSFLPLVARLSIELGLFEEQYLNLNASGNEGGGDDSGACGC
ncbi:hypothetical protein FRACYDRAFT_247380 [Fragilariopsis cylindrus CCMP1102]|uniref:Uncharacterized protein n=1 Tax=Fragilariopsis cylindrus CCMP1102 TaxID=635003 RepID=A0A1E7EWD7_9STRA|nr:hypothetical protein FRACYDRAFT_247380 [Fragilariopsis cylindrus CCMP1102]|eukprot:OEU10348.1 hypothetical protein FRACYDRAFT_247380 [Fragilariopsis cylindrus CCMP1102]